MRFTRNSVDQKANSVFHCLLQHDLGLRRALNTKFTKIYEVYGQETIKDKPLHRCSVCLTTSTTTTHRHTSNHTFRTTHKLRKGDTQLDESTPIQIEKPASPATVSHTPASPATVAHSLCPTTPPYFSSPSSPSAAYFNRTHPLAGEMAGNRLGPCLTGEIEEQEWGDWDLE